MLVFGPATVWWVWLSLSKGWQDTQRNGKWLLRELDNLWSIYRSNNTKNIQRYESNLHQCWVSHCLHKIHWWNHIKKYFGKDVDFNNICGGKKSICILNFLWLTPVNKELIPKELISFPMSKAAINQRLTYLENIEMG